MGDARFDHDTAPFQLTTRGPRVETADDWRTNNRERRNLRDYIEFFRQFRQKFETTGAIAPSSRFLAKAMTNPMRGRQNPISVLEVGPGTGAVTNRIVRLLKPQDRFDLVELNSTFVDLLSRRFREESAYQRVAAQSQIHSVSIEDFESESQYDFIISGLPLNNFPPELVGRIFDSFLRLLAPDGILSYFEYMYVRPLRKLVAQPEAKARLQELDAIANSYLSRHRFRRSWVFVNLPPAWVQHLRPAAPESSNRLETSAPAV